MGQKSRPTRYNMTKTCNMGHSRYFSPSAFCLTWYVIVQLLCSCPMHAEPGWYLFPSAAAVPASGFAELTSVRMFSRHLAKLNRFGCNPQVTNVFQQRWRSTMGLAIVLSGINPRMRTLRVPQVPVCRMCRRCVALASEVSITNRRLTLVA